MSQIFHRSTNTLSRATIFGAVFIVAALVWVGYAIQASPYVTYAGDPMPLMYQMRSLKMDWCLGCHRDPGKNLRPRDQVFNMRYRPPTDISPVEVDGKTFTDQDSLGQYLISKYKVRVGTLKTTDGETS